MYASTGDEAIKARAVGIVAELAKCQAALPRRGCHPGFLSAYPESFFDRVDQCKPVWAPYYTLHKIMAGLLDVYLHCGDRQALDVLVKMADWLRFRVDRLSTEQMQRSLENEHGGMNEVLANLYARDEEPRPLAARPGVQSPGDLRAAGPGRRPARRQARQHADSQDHRRGAGVRADRRKARSTTSRSFSGGRWP